MLAADTAVSATESAGPATKDGAATCAIEIAAIVRLGSDDGRAGSGAAYAAVLASPRGPGAATGRLWLNTAGGAFGVPFAHRQVLSVRREGNVDPIQFRLPLDARLQSAFVSELARADASANAACKAFAPWTQAAIDHVRGDWLQHAFVAADAALPAAQAIAHPITECRAPDVPARVIQAESPEIPPIAEQQGIAGTVIVSVQLDAGSNVVAVRPKASPSQLLVSAALRAAEGSRFQTAFIRCRPAAASYTLAVPFLAH